MREANFILASEQETKALGAALGDLLKAGDVVFLTGPLGAGKTALARAAIARRCNVATVPSPTFTLVETYAGADLAIWHFDFYRLEKPDDAWELGVEDAFAEGASLIEWPERAAVFPADQALQINLTQSATERCAKFLAPPAWEKRLALIAAAMENSRAENQRSKSP